MTGRKARAAERENTAESDQKGKARNHIPESYPTSQRPRNQKPLFLSLPFHCLSAPLASVLSLHCLSASPRNRTLSVSRGVRPKAEGSRAPLVRASRSGPLTGERTQRQPAVAARLAAEPTPRLDCYSAGQRDGRRPTPTAGQVAKPTECALTHYPPSGDNAVRFRHPAKRRAAIRPAPNPKPKSVFHDRENRRPP